ncbi:conserved hypothetical protein [Candidatus Sulfopaludibacter sp. SbA3]|nr:conserved hypothetical protein [Candidatus Sulfopaludibacter sp. SbA3]
MPAHNPAAIHALFRDAFNLGDLEGLIGLYEPDAVLVVDGKSVIGREAMRKSLERSLARQGRMMLETRAVIESQDLAVLHGSWVVEPTETGAEITTCGLSTEVVRKQPDGTWLYVIDSPFLPLQAVRTNDSVRIEGC